MGNIGGMVESVVVNKALLGNAGSFKSRDARLREKVEQWIYNFMAELIKDRNFTELFKNHKMGDSEVLVYIETKLLLKLKNPKTAAEKFLKASLDRQMAGRNAEKTLTVKDQMVRMIELSLLGTNASINDLPAMAKVVAEIPSGIKVFERVNLYEKYSVLAGVSAAKSEAELKSEVEKWLNDFIEELISRRLFFGELSEGLTVQEKNKEVYAAIEKKLMDKLKNPKSDAENFLKRILSVQIIDGKKEITYIKDVIIFTSGNVFLKKAELARIIAAEFGSVNRYRALDLYLESIKRVYSSGTKLKLKKWLDEGKKPFKPTFSPKEVREAKARLKARFKSNRLKLRLP